ncbi:DNA-3-methyladenine glycosylase family protein [Actinoallomurus rhizosphaericola]|uniref:DNA-3-methyladenine glycosylase family protein n=1 Tax=Actinoallomurus rhizosphaericola TaxID=2952536 RepID=UPI002092FB72|nr:DNA-3-methyladenine glycosylase 2 family protein [Actinoallomurus rhizosphaericola]MCO5998714.1 DNA-3-methyladenine glycosylase 2 family protein [Actinoallomurus rhizosphaericola]
MLTREASQTRTWRPPWPVDVRLTLAPHRRGTGDPAFAVTPDGAVWRASTTPDGPGTLRLLARGDAIEAEAWGPGAARLLDGVPDLLGAADDPASFRPEHEVLRRAALRLRHFRIGRTGNVFEALVPAVLEQKVVGKEAWRAWRYLVRRFGEPAPGPLDLWAPPPPRAWVVIPSWEWHKSGIEAVRARTIIGAARVASRLEGDDTLELDRRLRSLTGVGVWTSAEVRQRALGDADAVSVGDYHIPGMVGWALSGRKVDDAGMLELLTPYAGHRYRVTRLLELSGASPPRRGPRMPVRDYRHF